MSKSFETELINYFLSSGRYKIYELEREYEGSTIWMLQGSFEQFDELIVFVNGSNFRYARDTVEKYINGGYVGNKGINLSFIGLTVLKDDLLPRDGTMVHSDFIVGTALIQIDIDSLQVVQSIGASYALQITDKFLQYKSREKSSRSASSFFTVTNIIILVDVLIFTAMVLSTGDVINNLWEVNINTLLAYGAESAIRIRLGEYYRLFTPIFLHAGLLHIALNMYALKSLGSLIEKIYGPAKFALIYFASGIMGSIFSYTFSGYGTSVGASGAIFGLLGAAVVYGVRMRNRIGKGFLRSVFQVIFINLLLGFNLISNIDNSAHIGGLVGGLLITAAIDHGSKNE